MISNIFLHFYHTLPKEVVHPSPSYSMAHTDPSSPFSNSGLTTNDSEPECLNMITKGHIHTASPSLASVNTGEVREIGLVSATDSGVIINPAVPLKLPEIGDPVAVTGDGHGERPVLSELPYSLRTRKLKIAIIALIVSLDGFIMPTCIFYILKNTAHLSDTRSSFNFSPPPSPFPLYSLLGCNQKNNQELNDAHRCCNNNGSIRYRFFFTVCHTHVAASEAQFTLSSHRLPPPVVP